MIKNYIQVAVRNFLRHKSFSAINVFGLAIGISASLVMFLIVYYEFSYDKFEPNADRIYRVVLDATINGMEGHSAGVQAPLGAAIHSEVTGIEKTIPVFQFQGDGTAKVELPPTANAENKTFKQQPDIVFTNAEYFKLLNYKWRAGTGNAMQRPFSVVLTESRANKYFPGLSPSGIIGQIITYNDDIKVTVAGIVKDLDNTTSFQAQEFISLPTIEKTHLKDQFMMTVWNDWMAYSQLFVQLAKGTSPAETEKQINGLLTKYNPAGKDAGPKISFRLQPLSDLHFNANYNGVGQRTASKKTLYGLIAIAGFLLLLGCINFINLTTAQSIKRAKEIGIRKTLGSSKQQLIFQFLSETFLTTVIAAMASIAITPLLLKLFSDLVPAGLSFDLVWTPGFLGIVALLIAGITILSGIYPAIVLTAFKPAKVLKGTGDVVQGETRSTRVRKTLTVTQFVIAQFFIIATLMVSKQINYSLNADLGFNKDAILTVELPRKAGDHENAILNDIRQVPGVQLASSGFLSPADIGASFTNIVYEGAKDVHVNIQIRWGDSNYLKLYGIKLLAGRNVQASDSIKEFIINQKYARLLGFTNSADALGKNLLFNGKNMPIVGVMQDFHDMSFRAPISPLVFAGNKGHLLHIKLAPITAGTNGWQATIRQIEERYKSYFPEAEFTYKFYDETLASMYEAEVRTARLLKWATGLSILISCLGLLGLVIYTTNTRTKEIGIRKLLGAGVTTIVSLLSKDLIRLVFIAFLIAVPIAWWASYSWLQDFAYRTSISWLLFAGTGIIMLLLAFCTLSIQTIKAAMANPVKSLRDE